MLTYTNINHLVRKQLGLSMNEYALCDMVYHLSVHPSGTGWCYMSKQTMCEEFDLSKRAIQYMIERMIERGLLEKHAGTSHLRTTKEWSDTYLLDPASAKIAPHVQKLHSDSAKTAPNINKEDNNIDIIEEGEAAFAATPTFLPTFENEIFPPESEQPRKVEAKGGGAKSEKKAITFDEEFPPTDGDGLDLFVQAWMRSGHAKTHPTVDPVKLGYKVRNWCRGGDSKGNTPKRKRWLDVAANFITEKELPNYLYDHAKSNSRSAAIKSGDDLIEFFRNNAIPQGGF